MNSRTYTIKGLPISWKRAGINKKYGRYFDAQSFEKERVRLELVTQQPILIAKGPISISYTFYLPIPTSLSTYKKNKLPATPHFIAPDIDNLYKFYSDAFEGFLYTNDCQIAQLAVYKVYDNNPRTELTIESMKDKG
jgi:Holliday junction resolvase RusA-like endonuclease